MRFIVLVALLMGSTMLSAQTLDDVFDDGGAALSEDVVKFNLVGLYRGEAVVSYERLLADQQFGVEVGLGLNLGYYRQDFLSEYMSSFNYDLAGVSGGNSLHLGGRYYRRPIHRNTWSIALQLSNRSFTFEDPDREAYRVTDLGFGGGYVLMFGSHITVDLLYLVSFRLYSDEARRDLEPISSDDTSLSWAIPTLDLRIGYAF